MALGRKRRDRAARARAQKSGSFARPLWIEQLEDRRMLATFTVNNLGDLRINNMNELEVVPNSLRSAILAANETMEADTILFNENLSGTIFLQSSMNDFGALTIEDSMSIIGLGARKIGIQAAGGRRVFEIDPMGENPISVSIQGLTISGGTAIGMDADGQGGAILNSQNLTLTEVVISNSTANEGGGIYNTGNLTVNRSLILNNTAFTNGGGIQNGADTEAGGATEGPPARTTINSSTISGNTTNTGTGYGGGLFNRDGTMIVNNSTIIGNEAYLGSGIASFGNPLPESEEDDPPPPTIFTTITGSILFENQNFVEGAPVKIDIDVVGKGEEDDEGMSPPLMPSININAAGVPGTVGGFNAIFGPGAQVVASMGDLAAGTDPRIISEEIEDPLLGLIRIPILGNYGGSTDTYHPELTGSPVVNKISGGSGFDQRGRHFTRVFEAGAMGPPRQDIGAVEVQNGTFVVDVFDDEFNDGQYSSNQGVTTIGDFSIREALDFSRLNPLVDTINFNVVRDGQVDPTPSAAPTILLNNGVLTVDHSVNIVGPDSFVMEIDGKDPSPLFGNGNRIFVTSNGDVLIRNLTLLGGDIAGSGGAIFNQANLTLERSTIKGSRATLDGGAIFHDSGNLTLIGSTISGNNSSDDGTIYIDVDSGDVLISNTTISGNSAGDRGAGIFNRGFNTKIEFSTITNNTPGSTRGGGLLNFTGGHVEVLSSIISGNVFNNDVDAFMGGTGQIVSLGHNLIGTGNASSAFTAAMFDQFTINPLLGPLAFGGGLTQTHVLLAGSKAIDGGDPTAVAGMNGVPLNDQRGNPFKRVDPDSGIIDIGAYELQGVVFLVDNPGDTDNGNFSPGNLTLREAINLANLSPKKDFINFDQMALFGSNINAGNLTITDSVDIIGLGSPFLSLTGSGTVFNINNGNSGTLIDVDISGLSFLGRNIVSSENLILTDVDFRGNVASAITHQLGALAIVDSTITGNTSSSSGGGINAQNANVAIFSTTLSGNSTSATGSHGGGIFLKNSSLYGYDVILTNNLTFAGAADGAGLYADNSTVDLVFSVVSGNVTSGANSDGAGIFGKNSDISLRYYSALALNTTFGTSSKGGAVYINGGSFTVSDNTSVILNRTLGQFSSGGVIASIGGDVTILDTNVSQNSTGGADAHGGAIYVQDGNLHVENSAIFDNSTTGLRSDGGGIYSNTNLIDKQTTILNSTISGNITQDKGGGIYNADGLTSIRHSTISNNSAPYFGFGAGVGSFGNSATTRTDVRSSIIAGNLSPLGGGLSSDVDRINGNFSDSLHSLGYNLIGTGITGAFSAVSNDLFGIADPGLEPLALNGGVTQNHALMSTSLAINGGNPADVAGVNGVPEFDQIGQARVQNGRIDIGAYESALSPTLAGDFDGDGVVSGRDFLAWQRGNSPNPLSSTDLANWQANFGSSSPIVAALQVEEQEPLATFVSAAISSEPVALTPVATTIADDSQSGFTSSRSIQLGLGVPALFAAEPVTESPATRETAVLDAALSDAVHSSDLARYGSVSEPDFGDIVVSRGEDADSEEFAATDEVFDLIGSGAF